MTEAQLTGTVLYLVGAVSLAVFWAIAIDKAREDRDAWYRHMQKRLDDLGADK